MTDRNRELEGKVAIVTGSARNIGRSIAEELARAGAAVTINARSAGELCEEVAQGIRKAGGKAIACRADITDAAEVKKLVDATAEAFGGVSAGLTDGWAQRYSLGASYLKDTYAQEPGRVTPKESPPSQTLVAPFLRYEVVEDDFARVKNRDLIERPEFFAMGFQSKLELGRSLAALGSTQSLWLYAASASDGVRLPRGRTLLLSGSVDGQSGYSPLDWQSWNGSIRYYGNPRGGTLLFSSLSGGALEDSTGSRQLVLGGDSGLRGYPRNYQNGDRFALFSIEQRVYTDWYPFRLFRVGAAVFYDLGRAWGGPSAVTANSSGPSPAPFSESTANTGWLNDIGVGLRILSARSAFGNILHVDFAFPLNREPGIKSMQFLVTTKVTL